MLRAQTPLQAASGPLAPRPAPCPHCWHSLLQEQDDVLWRLNGCVQLDQIAVVQLVHNLDLKLHHFLGAKEVGGTIQESSLPALHSPYLRPDRTLPGPLPSLLLAGLRGSCLSPPTSLCPRQPQPFLLGHHSFGVPLPTEHRHPEGSVLPAHPSPPYTWAFSSSPTTR